METVPTSSRAHDLAPQREWDSAVLSDQPRWAAPQLAFPLGSRFLGRRWEDVGKTLGRRWEDVGKRMGHHWEDDGNGWLPIALLRSQLAKGFWTLLRGKWLGAGELFQLSVIVSAAKTSRKS